MSAQMDPDLPSREAATRPLDPLAAARPSQEPKEHAMHSPCPNRHSDRILAFLRKNPGLAQWFQ
jgi:hypothetical protein